MCPWGWRLDSHLVYHIKIPDIRPGFYVGVVRFELDEKSHFVQYLCGFAKIEVMFQVTINCTHENGHS